MKKNSKSFEIYQKRMSKNIKEDLKTYWLDVFERKFLETLMRYSENNGLALNKELKIEEELVEKCHSMLI